MFASVLVATRRELAARRARPLGGRRPASAQEGATIVVVNRLLRFRLWPVARDWYVPDIAVDGRHVGFLDRYRPKPIVCPAASGTHTIEVRLEGSRDAALSSTFYLARGRTIEIEVWEPRWRPFRGFGPPRLVVGADRKR